MLKVATFGAIAVALMMAILVPGRVVESKSIHEIVTSERRYVLYNSRQLTGECLDVCVPTPGQEDPTPDPTKAPTPDPTKAPTPDPTKAPTPDPTKAPTPDPTKAPTPDPTKAPTPDPTKAPTPDPTKAPTPDPTKAPTPDPTKAPTPDPTKAPTLPPTSAPTSSPTCENHQLLDLCVAIDNSGSICTAGDEPRLCSGCKHNDDPTACHKGGDAEADGKCCGNYESLVGFSQQYIDAVDAQSVSVVKFSDKATTIAGQGPAWNAKNQIADADYIGGWTNTQDAIYRCQEELRNKPNPVIVLITDGTPTACRKKGGGFYNYYGKSANDIKRNCRDAGRSGNSPYWSVQSAAENAADDAENAGITIVPVVINSVSRNKDILHGFARCPNEPNKDCGDKYKHLDVDAVADIGEILEDLIQVTGCSA